MSDVTIEHCKNYLTLIKCETLLSDWEFICEFKDSDGHLCRTFRFVDGKHITLLEDWQSMLHVVKF